MWEPFFSQISLLWLCCGFFFLYIGKTGIHFIYKKKKTETEFIQWYLSNQIVKVRKSGVTPCHKVIFWMFHACFARLCAASLLDLCQTGRCSASSLYPQWYCQEGEKVRLVLGFAGQLFDSRTPIPSSVYQEGCTIGYREKWPRIQLSQVGTWFSPSCLLPWSPLPYCHVG